MSNNCQPSFFPTQKNLWDDLCKVPNPRWRNSTPRGELWVLVRCFFFSGWWSADSWYILTILYIGQIWTIWCLKHFQNTKCNKWQKYISTVFDDFVASILSIVGCHKGPYVDLSPVTSFGARSDLEKGAPELPLSRSQEEPFTALRRMRRKKGNMKGNEKDTLDHSREWKVMQNVSKCIQILKE